MEEGPVSITTDVIDSLHRQLSAIEQVVHGMEDHLAECYRAIQNNNKEQGIQGMHVRGKTDIVDWIQYMFTCCILWASVR